MSRTSTKTTFVVAGGGLSGARAVAALRAQWLAGRVVLSAAEPQLPYQRAPLSKDFLAAKVSAIATAYGEADQRLTLVRYQSAS